MIMVDVYVASLDESFDFRVDDTVKIIDVVREISEMLCSKYKTELNKKIEDFMLCSSVDKKMLDINTTLWENDIQNGSRLLLV